MLTRHIAIVPEIGMNASEPARVSAALQKQVTRDLAPVWGISATVDAFPCLEDLPAGCWPLVLTFRELGTDAGIHIDEKGQGDDAPAARSAAPALLAVRKVERPKVEPKPEPNPSAKDERPATEAHDIAPTIDAHPEADTGRGLSPLQRIGLATGAAGAVGLGAGAFFTYRAVSKNSDSKSGCSGDLCLPTAKQDRLDARAAGTLATIGCIGGGVLTAAGVTMYILDRRSPRAPQTRTIEAIPSPARTRSAPCCE
jgi:hypothetical protein